MRSAPGQTVSFHGIEMKTRTVVVLASLLLLSSLCAMAASERGITVRTALVYLQPDRTSAKLATLDRGREVILLEKVNEWLHVMASVTKERDVTGWMLDKGVIRTSTPNGDRILYGEAVDSEAEAAKRGGRRGAAQDAMRLYAMVYEYFPQSPLAGEALYRSADVRWQLDRADARSRPSSKNPDPDMRPQIEEQYMRLVMRKFPKTKWADQAAFNLIDNRLCGEWQGASKCPEREADIYEDYAKDHPNSPAAPEALYNAATRRAALIEIYKTENKNGKIDEARNRARQLGQQIVSQYPNNTDWVARAQRLLYILEQNIATYGNAQE